MPSLRTTGSVTAAADVIKFGPDGPFRLGISGTWVGSLTLGVSEDGTTYDSVKVYSANTDEAEIVNAVRGIGTYRIYATAWTSGTATVVFAPV